MVEEAAVLAQQRVVGAGERPDDGVGEGDAAREVRRQYGLERLAERPLEERLPGGVVADEALELALRRQRLGQRREHPLRDVPGHRVEALPGVELTRVAADRGHGLARA